jgi:transposase
MIDKALANHYHFNYVRYTPIRNMSEGEKNELYDILETNSVIRYRSKIVLLAAEGHTVPEIRKMTNTYDKTIRKWIHRFNDNGVRGLFTEIDYSRMVKVNDKARKEIIQTASTAPRTLGLKFSTWSLRSIAGYVKEKKIIQGGGISHTAVRHILGEYGVEWRQSKTVLGSSIRSRDPEYDLKKSALKS